jgi:hypothetical protein
MYLSKGGRISLIKSTLSNLPTYFNSLFPLCVVLQTALRSYNEISCSGLGEEFKFHLVS